MPKKKIDVNTLVSTDLRRHFGSLSLSDLITATRKFPATTRVDLQSALEKVLNLEFQSKLLGLHRDYNYSTLTFSDFLDTDRYPVVIGPLQYDEIDIGEESPGRCLKQGLWIANFKDTPFAVLVASAERHGIEVGT